MYTPKALNCRSLEIKRVGHPLGYTCSSKLWFGPGHMKVPVSGRDCLLFAKDHGLRRKPRVTKDLEVCLSTHTVQTTANSVMLRYTCWNMSPSQLEEHAIKMSSREQSSASLTPPQNVHTSTESHGQQHPSACASVLLLSFTAASTVRVHRTNKCTQT